MPTPPASSLTLRQLAERDERVFPCYPLVARYFPSAAMEDGRKRLGRAIERGDGPGLVIGAPGTGKSLLLQVLAAQFHERFDVVLLAATRLCTRRALLQALLFELGLPYKSRDEGELRLSLLDHLLSTDECPAGLLLLVDEAQSLPSPLLDELRVMTNLVHGGQPRVRLVLAGSSALEESFAHPDLESFSQRLATRCYIAPLNREETKQFIRAQIAASNGAPDSVMASDAWDAIFEATDGVPRLINQLCDRALQFAAADGRHRIDRETIQHAWSDVQQLPTPWDTPTVAETESQVIEFGGLNDDVARHNRDLDDEVVEPTELDLEEETVARKHTVVQSPQTQSIPRHYVDPFAEEFEEEEVVLDSFAAWDDMFRRAMPRVENRRDPGFATLVQSAINASTASTSDKQRVPSAPFAVVRDADSNDLTSDEEMDVVNPVNSEAPAEDRDVAGEIDWPPLRLAMVSDPAPLKPIPLMPPSAHGGTVETELDTVLTAVGGTHRTDKKSSVEPPVLIVDPGIGPSSVKPPVRREEYRHLFSRLHSG